MKMKENKENIENKRSEEKNKAKHQHQIRREEKAAATYVA